MLMHSHQYCITCCLSAKQIFWLKCWLSTSVVSSKYEKSITCDCRSCKCWSCICLKWIRRNSQEALMHLHYIQVHISHRKAKSKKIGSNKSSIFILPSFLLSFCSPQTALYWSLLVLHQTASQLRAIWHWRCRTGTVPSAETFRRPWF